MKDGASLPTVLILGGDAAERDAVGGALQPDFDCRTAAGVAEARAIMSDNFVHVAVVAGRGGDASCLADWPETALVALSGDAPEDALHLPHEGWSEGQLRSAVAAADRLFQLRRENERLAVEMQYLKKAKARAPAAPAAPGFEGILRSPGSPMAGLVSAARQFASFDVPVLLIGAPSTGKAQLARAIHDGSLRSDQPFHSLDAEGLSGEAVAHMLFGQRKAAAGAPGRAGLVRRADSGTLYLAGLDTLPRPVQLRLLRLVRDGVFEIAGEAELQTSRLRLIAGTTCDPRAAMADGRLDPALYHTLSIAELSLPALAARTCDIPLLARAAADEASRAHGKALHGFSDAAMDFLLAYDWPGNLSELRAEVIRMLIRAQSPVLGPETISRHILQAAPAPTADATAEIMTADGPLKARIEAIEARILRETLTRLSWNKSRSAAELGLSRVGLRAKLDRYRITPPQTEEA